MSNFKDVNYRRTTYDRSGKLDWRYGGLDIQATLRYQYFNRAYVHSIELGYITDWSKNGHVVVFNADLGYERANGVIESYKGYLPGSSKQITQEE